MNISPPSPLIKASQLALGYNGHTVVNDLDLTVSPGEIVGLLGPNGTGKTTILRALAGLLKPKCGTALIHDQDVNAMSPLLRARYIGLVPQNEAYVWPLTVEEIVMLGRAPHRGWLLPLSENDRSMVERALDITELQDLRDRPIGKLSGGERQRVRIARALAQEPEVLLLDEPTANLDIHHQVQVLKLVRELVEKRQLTAIIAIHDLALAARYSDRLVLVNEGRAYAVGSVEHVLTTDNIREVFGVEAELYRDPWGQWALGVRAEV